MAPLFPTQKLLGMPKPPKMPKIGMGNIKMPTMHLNMGFRVPRTGKTGSSSIRMMTGGLGPQQAMQAMALSQATGRNFTQMPEDTGEMPAGSKLEWLLSQTNRLSFTPVLNQLVSQAKAGNFNFGDLASTEGQTLKNQSPTTGIDLAHNLGLTINQPSTMLGHFYNGLVGAAFDMSLNALNLLHIGDLSPEGLAAAKKGTGILPGSVGDQMIKGQRNLLKFGPFATTGSVDALAGHSLNYLGDLTHTLASPITNMFTEGKLNILRPFKASLDYMNREFAANSDEAMKFRAHQALVKSAIKDTENGRVYIDPKRDAIGRQLGITSPKGRLDYAVFRKLSQDTLPSKLFKTRVVHFEGQEEPVSFKTNQIDLMQRHAKIREAVANGLDYIASQKEKRPDTKPGWYDRNTGRMLVGDSGEFMTPELHHAMVQDAVFDDKDFKLIKRVTNSIRKNPPDVIREISGNLRKAASVWSRKAELLKFDRDNPEVFDPQVTAIADYLKPTWDEIGAQRADLLGLKALPSEEFEGARILTPGAREAMKKAGYGSVSPGKGGRIFGKGMADQSRIFGDFTTDQVLRMALDPTLKNGVLFKFGPDQYLKPQTKLGALLGRPLKQDTLFETDPMKALGLKMVATNEAVNGANTVKEIADMFGYKSPEEFSADPKNMVAVQSGVKPVEVPIPEIAQKAAGVKSVFLDPAVANEFKMLSETLSNPKTFSEFLNWFDNFMYAWRSLTLFNPLTFLATPLKFAVGHGFLSWLRNGFSAKGLEGMAQLLRLYVRRNGILAKGGQAAWEMAKNTLPTNYKGLNLKAAMDDLEKSGQFNIHAQALDVRDPNSQFFSGINKVTQSPLMTFGGNRADNTLSFAIRAQHYLTRLSQGWEPGFAGAAMRDTKHSLIDYAGSALTPTEQNVFRRITGFYAWTRFNIPLMLQAMFQQPGKISQVYQLLKNMNAAQGSQPDDPFLDSFIKGNLHVRVAMGPDGHLEYKALRNWLPLADLEPFLGGGSAADEAINMLNPLAKIALEQYFNKSTFFKTPEGEPQDLESIPGQVGHLMGLSMPQRAVVALQELFRPGNLATQYNPGGIFGGTKTPPDNLHLALDLLGLGLKPFDESRAQGYAGSNFRTQFQNIREQGMRFQKQGDKENMMAAARALDALIARSRQIQEKR